MFLSVKERARQIANGQLGAQPPASQINEPPPKAAPPPKVSIPKATPSKAAAAKPPSPKAAPPKPSSPKASSSKTASSKPTSPKAPIGAFPDIASPPPKLKRSKTEPPKAKSSKSSSSSKDKEKEKDTPSRPKPARTESSKSTSSSKKTPSKSTSHKSVPSTPVRSSFFSRIASSSSSASSSSDDESSKPSDEISELKAACLKQVNGVTGLGGKNLAIVCRQTSSNRQWYAALKDMSSEKYLKMWMNREKTYPTQVEALQAYLVFAKKMKDGCRLF